MTSRDIFQILSDNYCKENNLFPAKLKTKGLKLSKLCDTQFEQMCKARKPANGYCNQNAI